VRGTPQQIIDKYPQLTRDAQLSNDRVAAENFQQHAEHYTRMLAEAMREAEARREQQEAQQQQQRERNQRNREDASKGKGGGGGQPVTEDTPQPDVASPAGGDVIDLTADGGESGLVDTPESKPQKRQRRAKNPESDQPEPGASENA